MRFIEEVKQSINERNSSYYTRKVEEIKNQIRQAVASYNSSVWVTFYWDEGNYEKIIEYFVMEGIKVRCPSGSDYGRMYTSYLFEWPIEEDTDTDPGHSAIPLVAGTYEPTSTGYSYDDQPCSGMAWQPIETAPKGRIVLVHYKNRLGNGRTMRARYYLEDTLDSDTTESGWADEGWYEESEAYEYLMPLDGDPTHWMPLPPPPGSAQDASNTESKEATAEASKDSRTPMPEEVIRIMCKQPWLFETVQQWVRITERYHDIGKFVKPGESSGD